MRAPLTWVARGQADAGIVYSTDAAAAPEVRVVAAFPAESRDPIIYVSHNVAEVLRLADCVVVLDGGKVIADGGVEMVLTLSDVQAHLEPEPSDPAVEFGAIVTARVAEHDAEDGLTSLTLDGGTLHVPALQGAGR